MTYPYKYNDMLYIINSDMLCIIYNIYLNDMSYII